MCVKGFATYTNPESFFESLKSEKSTLILKKGLLTS